MQIAVAKSRFAKTWTHQDLTWEDLCARLEEPKRTKETIAEYLVMPKTRQADIKDVGGFIGGILRDGKRRKGHVESRSILALDLDYAQGDIWLTLAEECRWEACVYTTHKHTPDEPRLRLLLPLTRSVTEEEYGPLGRVIAAQIGIDYFDDTTYEAHRLMYWPSASLDGEYVFQRLEGELLDPDELLGEGWRDASTWPLSSRQVALPRSRGARQVDPTTKDGLIGAFCRAHSITDAMRTFLADVYEPTSTDDRWTYKPGEASNGVVIYDDLWSYSHHNTDPAGGQLTNSFDLVRLHRFGLLDEGAKEGTPTNRLPSYTAMTDLAREDEATKTELLGEAAAEFKALEGEQGDPDWQSRLTYDRKGIIESTSTNLRLILENDAALRPIVFNQLRDGLEITGPVPWDSPSRFWRDQDDAQLTLYIESKYGRFTDRDFRVAVTGVADNRRYHPIREYLESLPAWDGVARVETLLVDYLGAEDSAYVRAVTRKTLCAAIQRVYQPGCKFDSILVLSGPQGIGKSTLVARLARDWFNDSLNLSDTRDKTAAEKLQGAWIVEIGELAGMRKAEVETMRSFISRQDDVYRASFGRHATPHPRQCVFFGTTNAATFLNDAAGNRRFWPVEVPGGATRKPWDLTDADVAQLWAETLVIRERGERLYLEGAEAETAQQMQQGAMEVDDRVGVVEEYLNRPLPENWDELTPFERRNYLSGSEFGTGPSDGTIKRTQVCVMEVWCEGLGRDKAALTRRDSYAITAMLRSLGWTTTRKTLRVPHYGKQGIWFPESTLESTPGNEVETKSEAPTVSGNGVFVSDVDSDADSRRIPEISTESTTWKQRKQKVSRRVNRD